MATALITGAGGFVGQHLIRELLSHGHSVIGGTLDGVAPASGALEPSDAARVRWARIDVTVEGEVSGALMETAPDWIFHLAGQSSVGESFADVLGTWEANATGTLRLLLAASRFAPSSRVLLVSSSEVYGRVPESEQPIPELRPLRPGNPYGASKAAAEMAARQFTSMGGPEVVIARSFNHIGPGQSTRFALPNWAEQLGEIVRGAAEPVLRVGNLEARRDLLDVRDVARAYRLLMERGQVAEVYNVCSGVAHCLRDVVEELVEISATGARVEVDPERLRPVDAPLLLGDPTRLRALGWTAEYPLRRSLTDLLEFAGRSVA